jgi:uridine kinase
MNRRKLLEQLSDLILQFKRHSPLRVAIDGIDASGKTVLADELATVVKERGSYVIRASLDGFHRPRNERYRQGNESPEGYYEDSFNYESLLNELLIPLGLDGDRWYRNVVFDVRSDQEVLEPPKKAPEGAVLLLDGVFLMRPELVSFWDYRIFVDVDFDVGLARAIVRDQALIGSPDVVRERYRKRYYPAQRQYLNEVMPKTVSDVIVINNDLHDPELIMVVD